MHAYETTRRSLHAVAEHLLAGPQHREHGTIRLRVVPGGFARVAGPWRAEGTELVGPTARYPLTGTLGGLAAAGIPAGAPEGLYGDHADPGPHGRLAVDPDAARDLAGWLARGDAALRAFAPGTEPVLWPEHFDPAPTADEVTCGVSPGDGGHPAPYAYVGPWTPRTGPFWNAPLGARRPVAELPDAGAVAAFLAEGRAAAAGWEPPAAAGGDDADGRGAATPGGAQVATGSSAAAAKETSKRSHQIERLGSAARSTSAGSG